MKSNEVEPANRAEVTALLISAGYRVYRPEADIDGEDLILCTPAGRLVRVQQKPCRSVDHVRYEKRDLWMLLSGPSGRVPGRAWYLVEHDILLNYFLTLSQKGLWSGRLFPATFDSSATQFVVKPPPRSRVMPTLRPPPPDEMSLV